MSLGSVLCEKTTVGRNMAVGENVKVTPKPHGGISAPESQPQAYYYAENIAALGSRGTDSLFGDFDIGLFCKVGRALGSCEFGTRTGIGYDDSVSSAAAVKAVTAGLMHTRKLPSSLPPGSRLNSSYTWSKSSSGSRQRRCGGLAGTSSAIWPKSITASIPTLSRRI